MKVPQKNHEEEPTDEHQENSAGSIQNGNGSANVHQASELQERQQQHEEAMFAAVDKLCCAPEQTYEQFLSCFSYYKPDPTEKINHELAHNTNSRSNQVQDPQKQSDHAVLDTLLIPDAGHVTKVSGDHGNHCKAHDDEEDLLEEQMLNTGSTLPLVSEDKYSAARPMIKVDNFVDDEGINSDTEEYPDINNCEPYVASFASGNPGDKYVSTNPSTVCDDKTGDDPDPEDENKEMPSTGYSKQTSRSDLDTQTEIKFDSTGQPITDVDSPNPDDSTMETNNCLIQNLLYPGEILEEESTSVCKSVEEVTHVRQMEYSARMTESTTTMGHLTETYPNQQEHPTCDEVQPFCLDEDFDYDNVILTPKFSQKDIEELKIQN